MKKILTVIGARPQFVKSAIFSKAWRKNKIHKEVLIHTGQHYDKSMSDVFFDELKIPSPDYCLEVGSGSHGMQTGRMLEKMEHVMLEEKPGCVVVFGDTNSTLAASLSASKLHIPVVHIESGLRSFNKKMPEEINRVLTDHVSDLCFCPTKISEKNLKKEGISEDKIFVVGDIMYDLFLETDIIVNNKNKILESLNLISKNYFLVTIHRAENTDNLDILKNILHGLSELSKKNPVVFPMHPRTASKIKQNLKKYLKNIIVIDPVGYLDMFVLSKNASLIFTDSGGLQKESFFHRVPCITIRSETEWLELVQSGYNFLVPPSNDESFITRLIETKNKALTTHYEWISLYGSGHTGDLCAEILSNSKIWRS